MELSLNQDNYPSIDSSSHATRVETGPVPEARPHGNKAGPASEAGPNEIGIGLTLGASPEGKMMSPTLGPGPERG
jgi:hypothetical protein